MLKSVFLFEEKRELPNTVEVLVRTTEEIYVNAVTLKVLGWQRRIRHYKKPYNTLYIQLYINYTY